MAVCAIASVLRVFTRTALSATAFAAVLHAQAGPPRMVLTVPVDSLLAQAQSARADGRFGQAKTLYATALSRAPARADQYQTRFFLAECQARSNDVKSALLTLRSLADDAESGEFGFKAQIKLGDLYAEQGNYVAAVAAYRLYTQKPKAPSRDAVLLRMGNICRANLGQVEAAMQAYSTIMDDFPQSPHYGVAAQEREQCVAEIQYLRAIRLLDKSKYDTARACFEGLAAAFPNTPRALESKYYAAVCLDLSGRRTEALEALETFRRDNPSSPYTPDVTFRAALIQYDKRLFQQAAASFLSVANNEMADVRQRLDALENAARAYQKVSQWADAAGVYMTMTARFGNKVPASPVNIKIGFCLHQTRQFEKALGYFEKARQGASEIDLPEVAYWIASSLSGMGRLDEAAAEFDALPRRYPKSGIWKVTARMEAAALYEKTGKTRKAVDIYRDVVKYDGSEGSFGRRASLRLKKLTETGHGS